MLDGTKSTFKLCFSHYFFKLLLIDPHFDTLFRQILYTKIYLKMAKNAKRLQCWLEVNIGMQETLVCYLEELGPGY